jgi:hypothetical protein
LLRCIHAVRTATQEIFLKEVGPVKFLENSREPNGPLPCSARGRRTTGAGAAGGGSPGDRRRGAGRREDGRRATGGGAPDDQRRDADDQRRRRLAGLRQHPARRRHHLAGRWQRRALAPHRARGNRRDPETYPVRSLYYSEKKKVAG